MLMDKNLQFSSAQAVTATAASTNVYDIEIGNTVTTTFTPTPAAIIGNATYFGEDLGLGRGKGTPSVVVTTGSGTPITATSLQIAFQGAPMNNTAFASGLVSDLVFTTYIETDAILLAQITASTRIAEFDWPMRQIGAALPRFVRLRYIVGGANFAGLTINADVTLGPETALGTLGQYAANY
jgi:hypothetical protein